MLDQLAKSENQKGGKWGIFLRFLKYALLFLMGAIIGLVWYVGIFWIMFRLCKSAWQLIAG